MTAIEIELRRRHVQTFRSVIEEGFNSGNLSNLDELFHTDFVEHQRGFPSPDLDGLKKGIASLRRGIPDIRLRIVDSIAEEDKVCFLLVGTGTHQGPIGPLPGTGTTLSLSVIDICRFKDGVIIEHWGIPDQAGIMEQIGMPRPPRWLMTVLKRRKRKAVRTGFDGDMARKRTPMRQESADTPNPVQSRKLSGE